MLPTILSALAPACCLACLWNLKRYVRRYCYLIAAGLLNVWANVLDDEWTALYITLCFLAACIGGVVGDLHLRRRAPGARAQQPADD